MLPKSFRNLTAELEKLPNIGPKAAERLALYLANLTPSESSKLENAIKNLHQKIKKCRQCFNLSEEDLCDICQNKNRDKTKICVIENALDIIPIEKTNLYNGLYHVLEGTILPRRGMGPDQLKIKELINRIKKDGIKEIILGINPTTDGDITALYLVKSLKSFGIKITRLARGLPTGGNLEYADELTLSAAIRDRHEL